MINSYLVAGEMAIPRKAGPAQFQPHAFRLKSRSPSSGKFGRNSLNAGKAGPAWLRIRKAPDRCVRALWLGEVSPQGDVWTQWAA